jgi:hypothetical protein
MVGTRAKAALLQRKGIVHHVDSVEEFTVELIMQYPKQRKSVWRTAAHGTALTLIEVLNGEKAFNRMTGENDRTDQATLLQLKQAALIEYVTELNPLLTEKEFKLLPLGLGERSPENAVGVVVKSPGQLEVDVKLFFDRASGLLVKFEYSYLDPPTHKPKLVEEYLRDYREVNSSATDEKVIRAAKIANETPALLDYLRKHTLSEADRQETKAHIQKLGDTSFQVREKAKTDLVAMGARAAPLLGQAQKDPDPEIASRAKECLERIGPTPDSTVVPAVIRLLADQRPAEMVPAFLAYVPSAPSEAVLQEIQKTLTAVAYRDGKPDQDLVKTQENTNPLLRAVAIKALKEGASDRDPPGQRVTIKGYKRPTKGLQYIDGKKAEWELTDFQLFNKLDDKVFGSP